MFFPPGAHPTYVPLGLASLAGYAGEQVPHVPLVVADLNIRLWQNILDRHANPAMIKGFFQGVVGDFYRQDLYRQYQAELDLHYRFIQTLEQEVKMAWKDGHDTDIAELDELLEVVGNDTTQSLQIAFSVMYPGQLVFALYLSRRIKARNPDAEVVLGGAAMSAVKTEELLRAAPWLDDVYQGEGEAIFVEWLLQRPAHGLRNALDLTTLPDPDFSFANFADYLFPEPVLPVVFSRGCQWKRCKFCCHNASFRGYRTTSYLEFARRLQRLSQRYGARFFYLADQYVSAHDLEGISRAILAEGLHIRFHVMGRPGAEYSPEILQLAQQAGCRWISWGVESFSAPLLKFCDKGTTPGEIGEVLSWAHQAGISNLAMMIFGLPGTREEYFQETLDWATLLNPVVDAFTSSQFQLFGGTPFFRSRSQLGLELLQQEVLLQIGEHPVHSLRFAFHTPGDDYAHYREVVQWDQWKLFTRGGSTFYETVLCEHYLLHCTHAIDSRQAPRTPQAPQCPPQIAA